MSDTHGDIDEISKVIARERPFDMFIHCGDLCGAENVLEAKLSDCIVHMVGGNCDYSRDLPDIKEFHIGKLKVVLLHGHKYHVNYDISSLFYLAREREADIVMFGHIHVPVLVQEQGVTILNPGSLVRPRQGDRTGTYIVMTTDRSGDADFEWMSVDGELYDLE